MLEKMITIHFGIRPGLLSDDLIEACIADIIKKFKNLTVRDIQHAYERTIIQKDDWKNVTKREVLQPIENWWNQKEKIRLEFERFKKEQELKNQIEHEKQLFKEESVQLYQEAIVSGEWNGSVFHASIIARQIAEHIDQETKDQLWIESKREKKRIEAEAKESDKKLDFSNLGVTALRIFSGKIVEKGVELKIELS